jgi:hypothetical protein
MSTIKTQLPANAKKENAKKMGSTPQNGKSPKVVTNISKEALEMAFFSNAEVKKALNVKGIKELYALLKVANQKEFTASMDLAKECGKAMEYWKAEGKAKAKAFGLEADKNTLPKQYGISYEWFNDLVNASKVPTDIFADYVRSETEKGSTCSVDKLNDYFKKVVGKGQRDNDNGEGEGEGEGKKVQTIFTLSFKTESGNVSVRVDNLGKVTTSNTKEDIKNAMIFLSTHIVSLEK